jgi:dihydrofolate reductase
MGKLVVGTFVSLDGVMQAPGAPEEDTDGGFALGGWLVPHFDDVMGEAVMASHERASAFLLGRRSYDLLAGHWPRVGGDDPLAAKLNGAPKYLASRTRTSGDWAGTTVISDAATGVATLRRTLDGEIMVIGSSDLIRTLLAHDLVDEFRLFIAPIVLGSGKRLFAEGARPAGLTLVNSITTPSGVMAQTYRAAGAPAQGSFALDPEEVAG